jgi:hypothetical protein
LIEGSCGSAAFRAERLGLSGEGLLLEAAPLAARRHSLKIRRDLPVRRSLTARKAAKPRGYRVEKLPQRWTALNR